MYFIIQFDFSHASVTTFWHVCGWISCVRLTLSSISLHYVFQ